MSCLNYGNTKRAVLRIMEANGDPMSVQSIHSALTAKLNGQTPRFEILQDDLVSMQEDGFVMLASKTTYILTP